MVYMRENRSLAVLEILAHLPEVLPDKYMLGSADLTDGISLEVLTDRDLPENWATLDVEEQGATRQLGDDWLRRKSSVVLSIPSVTSGERNFLLDPEHPRFRDIRFHDPIPFRLDVRVLRVPPDQIQSLRPRPQ